MCLRIVRPIVGILLLRPEDSRRNSHGAPSCLLVPLPLRSFRPPGQNALWHPRNDYPRAPRCWERTPSTTSKGAIASLTIKGG